MSRCLLGGSAAVLMLVLGGAAVSCSDDGDSAAQSEQSTKEKQDEKFLSIVHENHVLSVKSDKELARLARDEVCTNAAGFLTTTPELATASVQNSDSSLDDREAGVVLEAAVKVYCPDQAPDS
ncbi:DUF732 domain-containing protein (plasmid) [Streptomyces sp. SDT5-1]|uniref:DUF732 domain-containing protein n=1 Tax=Streptomyces sp. SDT5-1 TaxID=3406418 RepID=UPI003FD52045